MLILILELSLTVAAWRKGWKQWALIPLAAMLLIGFLLGGIIASVGGNPGNLFPLTFLLDICGIAVLIGMVRRPPKPAQLTTQLPATPIAAAATQVVERAEHVTIH